MNYLFARTTDLDLLTLPLFKGLESETLSLLLNLRPGPHPSLHSCSCEWGTFNWDDTSSAASQDEGGNLLERNCLDAVLFSPCKDGNDEERETIWMQKKLRSYLLKTLKVLPDGRHVRWQLKVNHSF